MPLNSEDVDKTEHDRQELHQETNEEVKQGGNQLEGDVC